jgi:CheY-like chemotaxis protein
MDPVTLARAFEPFYTTKPVGEGTGLGLSVVYGIIKQSGGYIWLYSELGIGTSVKIYLPLVDLPTDTPAVTGVAQRGRGEAILVIEDEGSVRAMACRALEEAGYECVEAADGKEGLEIIGTHTINLDLVLCDVVMPDTNGQELGRRAAELRPELPILYMSAFPGSEVVTRGLIAADAAFIEKPFLPNDLAAAVRGMLDASSAATPPARELERRLSGR